jgi:hypothetical protein
LFQICQFDSYRYLPCKPLQEWSKVETVIEFTFFFIIEITIKIDGKPKMNFGIFNRVGDQNRLSKIILKTFGVVLSIMVIVYILTIGLSQSSIHISKTF